jgi:hypothetical protein
MKWLGQQHPANLVTERRRRNQDTTGNLWSQHVDPGERQQFLSESFLMLIAQLKMERAAAEMKHASDSLRGRHHYGCSHHNKGNLLLLPSPERR